MITIILKHNGKQTEVDMPIMYEELQLALWKLGLDRDPEKYTLEELNVAFRFQMPFESLILRQLEGTMTLLDAIAAIFSFIAPPHAIRDKIHLATFAAKSYSEAKVEMVRFIESSAQFESHCYYPIHGWLVGLDGDMKKADDQLMLNNADAIGGAVQKMQKWIIHDMALCYADTETEAEETLFQKILSARWSVEKKEKKLYGRIDLLLTEDLTPEEQEALKDKSRRITTQDMALRIDRWSVLTDQGILYISFGTGNQPVILEDDNDEEIVAPPFVHIMEPDYKEYCFCPACEEKVKKYGDISAESISDVEWLDFLVVGDHTLPRPVAVSDLEDLDE